MNEEHIVEWLMKNRKWAFRPGANSMSKRLGCTPDLYKQAKDKARKLIKADQNAEAANYVSLLENEVAKIVEQKSDRITGEDTLTVVSNKPLSPKEIDELAQVDNISSFVKMTWLKSNEKDKWTYSIQRINVIKDFYTSEELTVKLKDIFGKTSPGPQFKPLLQENSINKALFVYIGDDHCGILLKDSLFNKEYSGSTYAKRLLALSDEIKNLNQSFREIYIVRGGDELDGYNHKTTREGHELQNLSNKEQFDIYTIANKLFYDDLLQSGAAIHYNIINLNNSNHSGNGFSYIANKAIEFWLEARYPQVTITHQQEFIKPYFYGIHAIGLTHGKDEKHMKHGLPLNLDYKSDLWLMDYYKKNIPTGMIVSTVKFDLHNHNVNNGKSGRYVNVPSISSGSNWIENNYGDSNPGALLEIYTADSKNITSIPIWFN